MGTASRVDRWLLVEAPGPWSPRSLPKPRGLDDDVLLALRARVTAAGGRTLLIRRPGRGDPVDAVAGSRRVFAAVSRPGQERLLTRRVVDAELADMALPFDELSPLGWEIADRLLGVCTHGRHDPCCAVWGRPAAAALARAHPAETWEVSHLGGDRFAANVLVLPEGHYLGRVPPTLAGPIVDRLLAGERPDPYYRGRTCWPMPVQAALALTADRLDLTRLDALRPLRSHRLDDGDWAVTLAAASGQEWEVVVRRGRGAPARLTCTAGHEEPAPSWTLVDPRAD